MSIGDRIRRKRIGLRLTQLDIAKQLDITPQHVSAIEKNHRLPSIEILDKLAEALGVSIDFLVNGQKSILQDLISSIQADRRLSQRARNTIFLMLEELYQKASPSEKKIIISYRKN
ncbi:helix-turn-helix transcriptional regulator [Dehalogenimonas sp. 4OHTPN]|uniref:Helix-turn-helix transcriptional regulator n=1 Tax=Dehalogenimonas sp. 4OHTPN TaxID=3166643 RepID=A0AAU8GBA4_9CHLR